MAMKSRLMGFDSSATLAGSTALGANIIQELVSDGFVVGTDAKVNSNATTYHWIALGANSSLLNKFKVGRYLGATGDDRDFTDIGFQPDILMVKSASTANFVFRTDQVTGDLTEFFNSTAEGSNRIQSFLSNGFQAGSGSETNANGVYMHYFALKNIEGVVATGKYTGDGVDGKAITGAGFKPDVVIVKSGAAQQARIKTNTETTTSSLFAGGAAEGTAGILTFENDGFTVGTHASVNNSGDTFYWIALKTGNHLVPLTRTAV